ncbi:MAG: HAD superfamily hydrolase [Candidatus Methanohalarchaeum thermophilum]|uniref:HAD superfamily hydrolase n=1 Tax=Methanohalarchaeum thermophilum TaxID=1903181 RepID=A0A1Q6DUK9_METT1|nr:MAG: HAD superfamily hydrolase [Candidatus Methanohalarchaeum thermophilum]
MIIMGVSGFLFDLDGVLIDSMSYHADSFISAFSEYGIDVDEKTIYDLEGKEDRYIIRDLLEEKGLLEEFNIEEITGRRRKIFNEIENTKAFDGMRDLLLDLGERYRLALVSGSNRENMEDFVDKFFPGVFDCLTSGDDAARQKPHADPYLTCLDKLNLDREEAIVVENAPLGVESAIRAGIKCLAVATYVDKKDLAAADEVFSDHMELKKYIKEKFL